MKQTKSNIDALILANVAAHAEDLVSHVAGLLSLTPRMVLRHVSRLVAEGRLSSVGRTKGRRYALGGIVAESFSSPKTGVVPRVEIERLRKRFFYPVSPALREDDVWFSQVAPELRDLPENIRRICQHGLTEMLNNVVDHSEAREVEIRLEREADKVFVALIDDGVGVFEKIRVALGLADCREASLELYKGKFTTAPSHHSGEGIFFTSRAFDEFVLGANGCSWARGGEAHSSPEKGTSVEMSISAKSPRRLKDVFDAGSVDPKKDLAFDKTSFPVAAAQAATGALASRSQAKRVYARFEDFRAVELDFSGVSEIGQAFADEIFRVFRVAHPEVALSWTNAVPEVERMIRRAAGGLQ